MAEIERPTEDFQALIQPLVGLPISLTWKGYGSAIFLELGELAPLKPPRLHHSAGDACIFVSWDWRVESGATVLYGSSNSRPKIASGISALQGKTIQSLVVVGQIPELVVHFSNGQCLRSMVMVTGDPEWSIKLPDGKWVYARAGSLLIGDGALITTKEEQAVSALAEHTAARWGVPIAEPKRGSCGSCASFVPIDGEGDLLDYGVCIALAGAFDGRVVNRTSGCPSFSSNETA